MISNNGGIYPIWRADGKELAYASIDGAFFRFLPAPLSFVVIPVKRSKRSHPERSEGSLFVVALAFAPLMPVVVIVSSLTLFSLSP
jgi:hypothetical protein